MLSSYQATLNFVQFVPCSDQVEPLTLVTTLSAQTLLQAQGVVKVYAQRWAVETAFETMKAWGLRRSMVRAWRAIDRLLWLVALAYMLASIITPVGPC